MLEFLELSLALLAILFAAYQVKRLLVTEWNGKWTTDRERVPHGNDAESFTLLAIYWLCLVLALIVVMTDFMLLFKQLYDFSLLTWIFQTFENVYTHPRNSIVVLCLLVLAFVVLSRQRIKVLEFIETAASFAWYVLLELPVKVLLDPPYRGLEILSTNRFKALLYLSFYTLLYIILVVTSTRLVWESLPEANSSPVPIGLMYIVFYTMTFVANAVGSVFNWIVLHSFETFFTIDSEAREEDELPIKSVRRIYYTIRY